jgi:hypothetical protein
MKTLNNKLFALFLVLVGIFQLIVQGTGTILVITIIFSIPILLAKEDLFNSKY